MDIFIFDTCVLPRRGAVNFNPVLSALLHTCNLRGAKTCITDVILAESLNHRLRAATAAIEGVRQAISAAERVLPAEQLSMYLPDANEGVDQYKADLLSCFEVLATDGSDAVEALIREAARRPPAKATADGSAVGSRDASIWLTARRLATTDSGDCIHLVSSNTSDFADSTDRNQLREELLAELPDPSRVVFHQSAAAALETVADKSSIAAIADDLKEVLLNSAELQEALTESLPKDHREHFENYYSIQAFELTLVAESHAYHVGVTRLSLVKLEISVTVGHAFADAQAKTLQLVAHAHIWVRADPDDMALSVQRIWWPTATENP